MAAKERPLSEQIEQAQRQAEDALAKLPEPESLRAAGPEEEEAQQEAQTEQLVERALDAQSSASERDRLLLLEERYEKLLSLFQAQGKGQIELATEDDLPKPRKQWTRDELGELVTILIFEETDQALNAPVYVNINGTYERRIPRGVHVRVPRYVALALEDTKVEVHERPVKNGEFLTPRSTMEPFQPNEYTVKRMVPRFNFIYS